MERSIRTISNKPAEPILFDYLNFFNHFNIYLRFWVIPDVSLDSLTPVASSTIPATKPAPIITVSNLL
jgi:hypothetical protein